ncbi:MAG: methylmalonyl Co-A mutase-associated GTPase MeaB [Candidatus Dadabacteria bacterium]|nr:methylmalonyl Co-A mutase-associated GTPase MeaB [Candidatus Dadabacteria bacterium]NIS08050.1 methylmalonyl Co-A mutase-associated GTPase MeaB [Candidatus Dadabacteria bacterium]NIY22490.1 methylmalonyl Co-A mutase-associated GTPase MeaB [Candidatus Dadabacteria bacterium]
MSLSDKDKVLIDRLLKGDRASLARLISKIEDERNGASSILREITPHTGNSYILGITGPPGAGKSTFVSSLTALYRKRGRKVGIIAVDPSSPFTGGAVLGDRIRMQDHTVDKEVFIRSIGSRGSQGGLSKATAQIAKLYDAFGFDITIIETVGVGQTELDIIGIADTVIVILVPESGDVIQTMKAGLMEIADIFVVNKADREGAEKIAKDIKGITSLAVREDKWEIPILLTTANKNNGIKEALDSIEQHRAFQLEHGLLEQKARQMREQELIAIIKENLDSKLREKLKDPQFNKIVEEVKRGGLDPYKAASELISMLKL